MHTNRLFYACLGECHPSKIMMWRLNTTYLKYKKLFGEEIEFVQEFNNKVLEWINKYNNNTNTITIFNNDIEEIVRKTALKEIGCEKELDIDENLHKVINKYWWKYPNKVDRTILKFLCNVGWMSPKEDFERDCSLCAKKGIGREHYLDLCPKTVEIRHMLISNCLISDKSSISKSVLKLFYTQNEELSSKEVKSRIKLLQDTFYYLIDVLLKNKNN